MLEGDKLLSDEQLDLFQEGSIKAYKIMVEVARYMSSLGVNAIFTCVSVEVPGTGGRIAILANPSEGSLQRLATNFLSCPVCLRH